MRIHVALVCFATCCTAFACAAVARADAGARPFLGAYLQETRVVYPLEVGPWVAVDEQRYDQPELGVSVRYRQAEREDRWMDLYFYPAGTMFDPGFVRAFDHEVRQVEASRTQAGHAVETVTSPRTFDAPGEYDPLLGEMAVRPRSTAFTFADGDRRYHSTLTMTVRGLYFMKVRFSMQAEVADLDAVRAEGEAFLSGFARTVRIHNTGDCWRTLDVRDIPADGVKPQGILASANDGTEDEVWVMEDAILARPALLGDEARRQAPLALARDLHAALRGRCQSPESMDVEVPAGMREIRIEYRTPGKPAAQPSPRRPTRAQG